MTEERQAKSDSTLCDLFKLGYSTNRFSDLPVSTFKGPFICFFAGQVFKTNNLRKPLRIYADDEGFFYYIDADEFRHAIKIVPKGLSALPLEGPEKGKAVFFAQKPHTEISASENPGQPLSLIKPLEAASGSGL